MKGKNMKTKTSLANTAKPNPLAGHLRTACAARLLPLLLLTLPVALQAQFNFTTNNGTITITGYTGSGGAVTIPSKTNGLPVTSIGDYAFCYCYNLASVTMGTNVTSLGDEAFFYCTNLTSVTIGNNVTNIGQWAFQYCWSLTNVTIPNSIISIGEGAFDSCSDLSSVTIGAGVTFIGTGAFCQCPSLTALAVAANNSAFSSVDGVLFDQSQTMLIECPGGIIGNYTVPNGVTDIESEAFCLCEGLTSITIPDTVTYIGELAIDDCFSLTAITVAANNPAFSSVDGVLFDKSQTTLIQCPEGKTGSYVIPTSVASIGDYAFCFCFSLTSVTIPNGVTSIGDYAFCFCWGLTSVTIPNGVTSIGDDVFSSCFGLTSVTIPNSVTSIGYDAFLYCDLSSVTIPNGVTSIADEAFAGCWDLTGVYFQGNAPSMDSFVFDNDNPIPTVYYLPGTTGWDDFAQLTGIPTTLWCLPNPLILNNGPGFGVQTNKFCFTISWATNLSVVVEACTNLTSPVWRPVQTNTLTDGSSYFSDPHWTNYHGRFYRLRSP